VSEPPALTPEQKAALADAAARMKTVLRPARLARLNGWTVGVFGALSVLVGLVSGGSGIVVGLALVAVAWNEMRGVRRLVAIDPQGARILGWNQVVLGGVIVAYCAFAVVHARVAPGAATRQLEQLGGVAPGLIAQLTTVVYGAIAVLVGLVQLFFARYHFRAEARVRAFRDETPEWVRDVLARS
jgi:hypothetical protein